MTTELQTSPEHIHPPRKQGIRSRMAEMLIKEGIFLLTSVHHGSGVAHKLMKNREQQVGLTEGAIFQRHLGYPDPASGRFVYQNSSSHNWIAFDPNRAEQFPAAHKKYGVESIHQGTLATYHPHEIRSHSASIPTPNDFLRPFSAEDFYSYRALTTPDSAIESGLIRETTYGDAFLTLGLTGLSNELHSRRLADATVFQVTPKGNTLVVVHPFAEERDFSRRREEQQKDDSMDINGAAF